MVEDMGLTHYIRLHWCILPTHSYRSLNCGIILAFTLRITY